jgi:hypothetical protein
MESGFLLTLKSYSCRMKTFHASRMYRRQDLNVEQPTLRPFYWPNVDEDKNDRCSQMVKAQVPINNHGAISITPWVNAVKRPV